MNKTAIEWTDYNLGWLSALIDGEGSLSLIRERGNAGVKRQMNKTKIETCDYTWNPVTGCWGPGGTAEKPNRCPYCYAWKISARFAGGRILSGNMAGHEPLDPFAPKFHPDRLTQPAKIKKPSKIFVCSMADLFGDWVPRDWIDQILGRVEYSPQHTFQFLTKNPKRLREFGSFPKNCWVGTTVTNQADADERLPWLLEVAAPVRFVSHEPLLSEICVLPWLKREKYVGDQFGIKMYPLISWAIIGAQTGPGAVKPDSAWVQTLIDQYRAAGVPIFVKDSLYNNFPIREWPA